MLSLALSTDKICRRVKCPCVLLTLARPRGSLIPFHDYVLVLHIYITTACGVYHPTVARALHLSLGETSRNQYMAVIIPYKKHHSYDNVDGSVLGR